LSDLNPEFSRCVLVAIPISSIEQRSSAVFGATSSFKA
jgi:hypothetical protein